MHFVRVVSRIGIRFTVGIAIGERFLLFFFFFCRIYPCSRTCAADPSRLCNLGNDLSRSFFGVFIIFFFCLYVLSCFIRMFLIRSYDRFVFEKKFSFFFSASNKRRNSIVATRKTRIRFRIYIHNAHAAIRV